VILVDQLNQIHFDAELEIIVSSGWFGRMVKKNKPRTQPDRGGRRQLGNAGGLRHCLATQVRRDFQAYKDTAVKELLHSGLQYLVRLFFDPQAQFSLRMLASAHEHGIYNNWRLEVSGSTGSRAKSLCRTRGRAHDVPEVPARQRASR
jgi:hypothetical protein